MKVILNAIHSVRAIREELLKTMANRRLFEEYVGVLICGGYGS